MRIRKAVSADAEKISGIVCSCYEDFERTEGYPHEVVVELKKIRGSVDCIRRLIDEEVVLVAADGRHVKGMVSIKNNEITKLYVEPQHQRQGIGKMLFSRAEVLIRGRGFMSMFLGAAGETMIPFYTGMGMRVSSRREIEHGPCTGMISTILEKGIRIERDHESGDSEGS